MIEAGRMEKGSKLFYVVFAKDDHWQHILDLLRMLANPNEKFQAHITVRGPYKSKSDRQVHKSHLTNGTEIYVNGTDAFLTDNQNTVFLNCQSTNIIDAWWKPDFTGHSPRPHITIYDGGSRVFADKLLKIMTRYELSFKFHSTALRPLSSGKGQMTFFLTSSFDSDTAKKITGADISAVDIKSMCDDKRLHLIEKVCEYVSKNSEIPRELNHRRQPDAVRP